MEERELLVAKRQKTGHITTYTDSCPQSDFAEWSDIGLIRHEADIVLAPVALAQLMNLAIEYVRSTSRTGPMAQTQD